MFKPYSSDRRPGQGFSAKKKTEFSSKESSGSHSYQDTLTGEVIYTKNGNNDTINIEDLRSKLQHLKDNSSLAIRKLNGKLKDDFDALARYVAWTYDSESYPVLYGEIQRYFHPDDVYQPGTVGAYCGGCLVKRKGGLLSRGCNVICAGSIPPPQDDPGWAFCYDLVIWAVYDGSNFSFTTLNEVEDNHGQAIIYVNYPTLDEFPGFSEAEKRTLSSNGIQRIRLVYYNPNGDPINKDLTDGFVELTEIKTRSPTPTPTPAPVNNDQGYGWIVIVLIIIVIAAILYFLCRPTSGIHYYY